MTPHRRSALLLIASAPLAGCASLAGGDPPRVDLVGLDGLPGQGLELRFLARLRVQNPGERELAYDGISLELDLRGQRFASGVAPVSGLVPRYGEAVIGVPLSVSGLALARQIAALARDGSADRLPEKLPYALRGRLGGQSFGGGRFETRGEIELPRL